MKKAFDKLDKKIVAWMKHYSLIILRVSLAIVFIWFGFLKTTGDSPAQEIVTKTIYWFDPSWFVPFLGWWEVAIGLCMLWRPLIRGGIFLMALQMIGTFLPLIILPEITFIKFPFVPSLEGQYIIKNLVLIAAGIVVGSHVRDKQ